MTPRIIIGSETEYGILLTNKGKVLLSYNSLTVPIQTMLNASTKVVGASFCSHSEGIKTQEEHRIAEQAVQVFGEETNVDLEELLHLQRRGYTGNMLQNGARFYQDGLHPEYSCPETDNPYTAVVLQKAGDRIVSLCQKIAEEILIQEYGPEYELRIDKNNSDGKGSSYAAHENYTLSPRVFNEVCRSGTSLSAMTLLFFVARQIITGAGKVGHENVPTASYQISQRADFMVQNFSHATTENRGIINRRDVPYADHDILRRFHMIVGDSNLSELSLYLKFGMTGLFFMMLDDGFLKKQKSLLRKRLSDPVKALHFVSRDLTLQKPLSFEDGTSATALEIMSDFVSFARMFVLEKNLSDVWLDVVQVCESTLDGLGGDKEKHPLASSLDWIAKKCVIDAHIQKTGVTMEDSSCRAIDLQYHNMKKNESIFERLRGLGRIIRIVDDADIDYAIKFPPINTRSWLRGEIIRRYGSNIKYMRWDTLCLTNEAMVVYIRLPDPFYGTKSVTEHLFHDDPLFAEFIKRIEIFSTNSEGKLLVNTRQSLSFFQPRSEEDA